MADFEEVDEWRDDVAEGGKAEDHVVDITAAYVMLSSWIATGKEGELTFLIDPEGNIIWKHWLPKPKSNDGEGFTSWPHDPSYYLS